MKSNIVSCLVVSGLAPSESQGNNLMACQTLKFSSAIIPAGNALQGPVNDWALLGFAGRSYANNNLFRQCPVSIVSLQAMPCKARSLTGPCWALLEGMISSSKALQGPVNDWALLGFAGRSDLFKQGPARPSQ